jgi:cysteine desulfurase
MIYFDHNATTPITNEVLEAMLPFLKGGYGNPSSVYGLAREARHAVETAREQVAELVNAHPSQVVFTSGGTEANNFALKGAVLGLGIKRLFFSAIEHASVRDVARYIEQKSWAVVHPIPVDENAQLTEDTLRSVVDEPNSLVSIMGANNEIGIINPLHELVPLLKARDAIIHSDAVQLAGKVAIDFAATGVDLMTLSSHKLYGPKGVGALVCDKSLDIEPLIHGGGQEKGRRSGTENVAAIVGFGAAAVLAKARLQEDVVKLKTLQLRLEAGLDEIPEVTIFAKQQARLPNTTFFGVTGIDGETLLMQLDGAGFAVASGSACASKTGKASHVLLAMGIEETLARGAIRVSFGIQNSIDEVDDFLWTLSQLVTNMKSMSALMPG